MKFAYETKYGSPEAAKVKAAGAKWNRDWRVWLSEEEIKGLIPAAPDHRKAYKVAGDDPKATAVVKVTHVIGKLETVPEEKVQSTIEKLDDGTYTGKCCAFALRLYADAKKAGISTRGFWTRPANEIKAEIEKTKQNIAVP